MEKNFSAIGEDLLKCQRFLCVDFEGTGERLVEISMKKKFNCFLSFVERNGKF